MKRSRILGTGRCLPSRVVTNDELSKILTTNDEWIQQRTGVKERRYVAPGQGPADLGAEASRSALDAAGLKPSDVDFIICATQSPQAMFPGTACFIQPLLGVSPGVGALDVRDQCTGFLYGLSIADAYVRLGIYKRILLVCAEVHSTGLEFADRGRHITVLFGDGAGAVVVGESDSESRGIRSVLLHADGRFARDLIVEAPGSAFNPQISHKLIDEGMHYPKMNGKAVFTQAVMSLVSVIQEALQVNALAVSDVDFFLPHQANLRITEAVTERVGISPQKVDNSIQKYGNCAAASVPIALDERVRGGDIKPGDTVLMATFAAGFTWGAAVMDW